MDEEPNESLCVRIKERTGRGDIIVGVDYRSSDQEEQLDEASTDREQQPHICRPWSSWGTLSILISPE